jgi:hypothetical protein
MREFGLIRIAKLVQTILWVKKPSEENQLTIFYNSNKGPILQELHNITYMC